MSESGVGAGLHEQSGAKQDEALEVQRRQDRLEQAADRAAAAIQRSLADLQSHAGPPIATNEPLPAGVSVISIGPDGVTVRPEGSLLYYPISVGALQAPSRAFTEGERLEFSRGDPGAAAVVYDRMAASGDAALRAGALARLARVRRKVHDPDGALSAYRRLAQIENDVTVDGIPAALVARAGSASVFQDTSRTAELRAEAAALHRDLLRGRWQLVKSEYQFYSAQAGEWLGTAPPEDADALARAEAVGWLWQNRLSADSTARRSGAPPGGSAFVAWTSSGDRVSAVVAGPKHLATLGSEALSGGLRLSLSDLEGRAVVGDPPPARHVAVRTTAAAGLPWTLHVFAGPEEGAIPASPRRQLLSVVFVVVALVLAAGWYFILRAITRERRVSQLQSDFVAAVSHEFRSPLTSLSHIAEMLARDRFPSDELRRTSYDVLVRDTDRLRRLVENLLDFGRFEAGAATLRLESVDIADLVRTIVADFQERVAPEGYSIEVTGTAVEIYARADREAFSRALWNLLDNAVKYSPKCRTVWVDMDRQADRVSIVVRDQGLGIPVHEQRDIFDRFVRGADSKALRIKGTGIGLAMVRQIVQAHGGEIRLASEPGRGSRFTITLRVVASSEAEPSISSGSSRAASRAESLRSRAEGQRSRV